MADFYSILKVDHNASQEDIKRSYRSLALSLHPDKAGPQGVEQFVEVKQAYDVLIDPKRRSIYDRFGEKGLRALDDPAAMAPPFMLSAVFGCMFLLFMLVCFVLVLVFLVLLGKYVDGKLSSSWNYIKVFSPLFVVAGLVAISTLPMAIVAVRNRLLGAIYLLLATYCLLLLIFFIPIVKHRNERNVRCSHMNYDPKLSDCLKWRVWLCPAYIMTFFIFLEVGRVAFLNLKHVNTLWKIGMRKFVVFLLLRTLVRVLMVFCVGAFFILTGCRSDEIIKTNYFIVVGIPFFICGFLILIECLLKVLLSGAVSSHFGGGHPSREGNESESRQRESASEPRREPSQQPLGASRERGSRAHPTHSTPLPENERTFDSTRGEHTEPEEGDAATKRFPFHRILALYLHLILCLLFVSLILAVVVMLCVRLNFYSRWGSYVGTLSLRTALIPLYIVFSLFTLFGLILSLLFCCSLSALKNAEFDDNAPGEAHHASGFTQTQGGGGIRRQTSGDHTVPREVNENESPQQEERLNNNGIRNLSHQKSTHSEANTGLNESLQSQSPAQMKEDKASPRQTTLLSID